LMHCFLSVDVSLSTKPQLVPKGLRKLSVLFGFLPTNIKMTFYLPYKSVIQQELNYRLLEHEHRDLGP